MWEDKKIEYISKSHIWEEISFIWDNEEDDD